MDQSEFDHGVEMTPNGQFGPPGDHSSATSEKCSHPLWLWPGAEPTSQAYRLERATAREPQFYGERLPSPTDAQTSGHHCRLDLPYRAA